MNHKYRILERMLIEGQISRQDLMELEPQSFGPPELHEHI